MTERRLLVLDDEAAVGELVCRHARRSGMEAHYCRDAEEFFAMLRSWRPTHVFVDLVMPEVDGVEVLGELAREGSDASIILGSGFDPRVLQSAERAARARGLMVVGVLTKPFSLGALREMLTASPTVPTVPGNDQCVPAPPEEGELDRALASDEIFVAYQPKWCLQRRRPLGFEALVRWRHPRLGIVRPDAFVPLAERSGRVDALTEHVVRSSLAWFGALDTRSELILEVNISGASLASLSPERMDALCADAGVGTGRIVLEVTETSQIADSLHAADVLNRLRIKGFGLAIDDYGVGYSSLSQLALFPFTELKIDKMFVEQLARSAEMRAIVQSTIGLAHTMGLRTVAEGVENGATMSLLDKMGCDAVQGYAIARPMQAEQARVWLAERGA
jgi:EAL domain-containing protein (putative c-di-GMP-specific phosphodiesterase class I)/CheY-like chemotaxis protein